MLRRKDNFTPDLMMFGGIVLNRSTYELSFKEISAVLSGKEFLVMEFMMQKPNMIVPTEQFITHT